MKTTMIPFNAAMVRAILSGAKTQTRRIMAVQPPSDAYCMAKCLATTGNQKDVGRHHWIHSDGPVVIDGSQPYFRNPYGYPGDRLLVRETARIMQASDQASIAGNISDNDDSRCVILRYEADGAESGWLPYPARLAYESVGYCVSNGCYKEAARITLEIVSVRVERLNAISDSDAKSEGIIPLYSGGGDGTPSCWGMLEKGCGFGGPGSWNFCETPPKAFRALWNKINGPRSWTDNPWVWVVEFKRL